MVITNRREELMEVTDYSHLKDAIAELELKLKAQKIAIKTDASDIKESVMPLNLLKGLVNKVTRDENGELTGKVLTIGATVVAGIVAKKWIGKKLDKNDRGDHDQRNYSKNSYLGTLAKDAAIAYVAANADTIKNYGKAIFKNLFVNKDSKIL